MEINQAIRAMWCLDAMIVPEPALDETRPWPTSIVQKCCLQKNKLSLYSHKSSTRRDATGLDSIQVDYAGCRKAWHVRHLIRHRAIF